ncbi:MAG TPA: TlyA family RNA methyltransferase [Syntrophales bacterium]|nr:TlyA family RNA methyltransferase [Syntrophales bacterium]
MIKKESKVRLDRALVDRGLTASREQARALILAGRVLVNDFKIDKAGSLVTESADVRIVGDLNPFVSRGGLKLQGALAAFGIDVTGLIVLDVGASTGGFTDCLLQTGAQKVYALDVGYGQLAWKLRSDDRVSPIERTNIRYFDGSILKDPLDMATVDASFISLKIILPKVVSLIRPGGIIIALIKPQFEVGRGQVGKQGVVSDPLQHQTVIEEITQLCRLLRLEEIAVCESPLHGPAGNREFFICARRPKA